MGFATPLRRLGRSAHRGAAVMMLAIGVVAVAGVHNAPARAAGSSADVSVTMDVRDGKIVAGQPPSTKFDPSAGVVINDYVTVIATVHNAGPDATTVTYRQTSPAPGPDQWIIAVPAMGWTDTDWTCGYDGVPQTAGLQTLGCTFTLGAGQSQQLLEEYEIEAPGAFTIASTATGATGDPNASNDTAAMTTTARCSIEGTPGDDVLVGATDTDSLCGEGGNDTLVVTGEGESAFGGAGNDTISIGQAGWAHTVDGDGGTDTVSFADSPNPVMVCTYGTPGRYGSGGRASPEHGGANMFSIEGFIGSPYADWIDAGPGSQTITGGRGWDTIRAGKGTDTVAGGPGNDRIFAADHTLDHINGGLGTDHARADAVDKLTSATDTTLAIFDPCNG
jgi:Ca2+-binding RTX toxin-like protein